MPYKYISFQPHQKPPQDTSFYHWEIGAPSSKIIQLDLWFPSSPLVNSLNKRNHRSEDILPGQGREDEGAPVVQGPNLEVDRLELTGGEHGLEVKRKIQPNFELTERQL